MQSTSSPAGITGAAHAPRANVNGERVIVKDRLDDEQVAQRQAQHDARRPQQHRLDAPPEHLPRSRHTRHAAWDQVEGRVRVAQCVHLLLALAALLGLVEPLLCDLGEAVRVCGV